MGRCPGKQGGAWFPEIKLGAASSHGRFLSGSCCLNEEDSLTLPESGSTWPRLWAAASGQTATVIPQAVGLPQGSIWGGGWDGHCMFLASVQGFNPQSRPRSVPRLQWGAWEPEMGRWVPAAMLEAVSPTSCFKLQARWPVSSPPADPTHRAPSTGSCRTLGGRAWYRSGLGYGNSVGMIRSAA